jgi:hypothetical protein
MDKARIAKLCNEIEDIVSHIERMNTNFATEVKLWNIHNKIKEIAAEITEPPKSNADRIRQMTDEELAEMLLLSTCYFGCNKCKYNGKCKGKSCTEAAVEWLKQDVNENHIAGTSKKVGGNEDAEHYGRWEEIGGYEPENHGFACSVCDFATMVKSRFCPNCGARMDATDTNDGSKVGADNDS